MRSSSKVRKSAHPPLQRDFADLILGKGILKPSNIAKRNEFLSSPASHFATC